MFYYFCTLSCEGFKLLSYNFSKIHKIILGSNAKATSYIISSIYGLVFHRDTAYWRILQTNAILHNYVRMGSWMGTRWSGVKCDKLLDAQKIQRSWSNDTNWGLCAAAKCNMTNIAGQLCDDFDFRVATYLRISEDQTLINPKCI